MIQRSEINVFRIFFWFCYFLDVFASNTYRVKTRRAGSAGGTRAPNGKAADRRRGRGGVWRQTDIRTGRQEKGPYHISLALTPSPSSFRVHAPLAHTPIWTPPPTPRPPFHPAAPRHNRHRL